MKRTILILFAILLVFVFFVSCKVEVNENSGETVILRFRTEDNDRALSGLREVIDSSKYVWYYTAEKADNTPATGTKTVQTMIGNDGKITNQVAEPFSLGLWNFTLYGYKDTQTDANLVYKGTVSGYEIKSDSNTIDVTVEPQKPTGGKGTIKVDEKIKLTANGVDYPATEVTVKKEGTDTETKKKTFDTARADIVFDNLDVGAYTVTVAYKPGTITYATNSVTVNVWNHLTTTISGRLDEKTVYKSFSAADGVATDTKTIDTSTINTNGLTLGLSPAAAVSAETVTSAYTTTIKGDIVKTGGGDAKVKVDVYDLGAIGDGGTAAFKVEEGENAVAALDLTLENAKINNGVVIVTTFISKGLSSVKLYHSNNQMDVTPKTTENEVTADNNWFYGAATGKLVFATSSFSPFHVTSEMNVYDPDSNKSYKLEKKDGEYKLLDKDGQEATAAGANLVLLDCTLSNAVPDALLSKNWTVIHARCAENTGFCDEESSYFSGGRGTKIEPYLIADKDQFQKITDMYDKYAYYRIKDGVTEIDCSDWTSVKLFGSFDGNGVKLKDINQKLFYYVGKLPSTKEAAADLSNWDTTPVVLKNFEANFNLEADLDAAAGMIYQINGNNTTTFDNVTISGRIAGGSNSGAFFTYTGPNYYDQEVSGMKQKIVVNNSLVTAELTCTAGVGVIAGYPKYCNKDVVVHCDKAIDELFKGTAVVTTGSSVRLFAFDCTYVGKNGSTTNEVTTTGVSYMAAQIPGYDASTGYSVNWAEGAQRMEVFIAAQLDETEENSDTRTAVVGITLTLKHTETKTKSEGNTSVKVLESFTSVELLNKQSAYDAAIADGKLTAKTGGDVNYTCGKIKLQVAQYDANGKMVAFGSKMIAERTTYNESWRIIP